MFGNNLIGTNNCLVVVIFLKTFLFVTVNVDNKVGAVGFMSRIITAVYPIALIKVDPVTGEPIRNKKGLCEVCQ